MLKYNLMNSDLAEEGYSPRAAKTGDTIEIKTARQGCPWVPGPDSIPPGNYKLTSRKRFTGGSIEIQPI